MPSFNKNGALKSSKLFFALLNSVDDANFFTRIELTNKFVLVKNEIKSAVRPRIIPNQNGKRGPTEFLPFNKALT